MRECLVNGAISGFVTTADRGLGYGDGLFETVVIRQGRPRMWQGHMDRLRAGCERLGIDMPHQALLLREVQTVSAGYRDAVVKVILTREPGGRGYAPASRACTRIVSVHRYPDDIAKTAREGVAMQVLDLRLAIQPALGGIKHLNRLEQVLASAELAERGAQEGVLLDTESYVISAVSANIYIVLNGQILTPRLDRCGIRGVVRGRILSTFVQRCEQRRVQVDQLFEASEVFLSNAVRGIVPVTAVDDHDFPIGPVTRELQAWFTDGASRP